MLRAIAGACALTLIVAAGAAAQSPQQVEFDFPEVNLIQVTGTATIAITAQGDAGSVVFNVVPDNLTSYAITTTTTSSIYAELDTAMPEGLTLTLELQAPTESGLSAGQVNLVAEVAVPVVGAITEVNESGLMITYSLTLAEGRVPPASLDPVGVLFTVVPD